jgi:hypothetical protein
MMEIKWIYGGEVDRIPQIGEIIPLPDNYWQFKVEEYGESGTLENNPVGYTQGETCFIMLKGCLVLPAGSPISALEEFLTDL